MELASIAAVCNSAVSPKLYKFIFCPSVFLFLSVFWYADCFPTFFCVITELSVSVTTVYLQWHSGYLVLTLRDRFLCKLLWGRQRLQNYIKSLINSVDGDWHLSIYLFCRDQLLFKLQRGRWLVLMWINLFYSNTFFPHPSLPGPALVQAARRGKAYSPAKLFAKSCMPDLWAMAEYWLDNIQKCGNNLNWFWIKSNWNRDPYCLEKYEP